MDLNRRNILFTLGTIAAGSGTALATGAFSSLSADRTVTINVASDADAVLSLEVAKVDGEDKYRGLTDGGSEDVIELHFDRLNQHAVTTFAGALEIGNNGTQRVTSVTIDPSPPGDVLTFSGIPENIDPGDTEEITLIVDLKSTTSDPPDEITITAET